MSKLCSTCFIQKKKKSNFNRYTKKKLYKYVQYNMYVL